MIWGEITFNKILMFMKKSKSTTMDFVEQVYGPVLLDFYSSLQNPILMEDNAPVHTTNYAAKVEGRLWI